MNGNGLTQWRKTHKITRKKLAELTGYTARGLLYIENAKDKILPKKLLTALETVLKNLNA